MDNAQLVAISERLNRLERENRRLKRGGALALVAVALLAAGGAKLAEVPKVIETEQLILRDSNGKMRARLSTDKDGSPLLGFGDAEGNPRAILGLIGGSPSIHFFDS